MPGASFFFPSTPFFFDPFFSPFFFSGAFLVNPFFFSPFFFSRAFFSPFTPFFFSPFFPQSFVSFFFEPFLFDPFFFDPGQQVFFSSGPVRCFQDWNSTCEGNSTQEPSEDSYDPAGEDRFQPDDPQPQDAAGRSAPDESQFLEPENQAVSPEHLAPRQVMLTFDGQEQPVRIDGSPLVIYSGHHSLIITSGKQ